MSCYFKKNYFFLQCNQWDPNAEEKKETSGILSGKLKSRLCSSEEKKKKPEAKIKKLREKANHWHHTHSHAHTHLHACAQAQAHTWVFNCLGYWYQFDPLTEFIFPLHPLHGLYL